MDNKITTNITQEDILNLGWELSKARDTIGQGKVFGYLQRFKDSDRLIIYNLSKQSYNIHDNRFFLTWHIMDYLTDFEGELNILLQDITDLENLMKILDIKDEL
jgi:hypothetical protein